MDKPTQIDATANAAAKIPIVVGVVGHNDPALESIRDLQETLRYILGLIHSRYGNSPIEVLSSLAEGSDQMVAKVALEMGWSVRVPLPFPPDVYAESDSIRSEEARDSFRAFLKNPRVSAFVAPLPDHLEPEDDADWKSLRDETIGRHTCYANAGGYIVRHCAVLIALWDGEPGEPAGTEESIRFMVEGKIPTHYPWRQPLRYGSDTGPVIAVHTPREGRPYHGKPKPGTVHIACAAHRCGDSAQALGTAARRLAMVLPPRVWNARSAVRKQEPQRVLETQGDAPEHRRIQP